MSNIGKKPSFEHIRTDELVVQQGSSIALAEGSTSIALDVSEKSFIRLTVGSGSPGETVIAGILAPLLAEPARNGKMIVLKNDSSVDIIFKEENALASADNRILIGTSKEHTLSPGGTICFAYDNSASRWGLSSSSSEVISSLVVDTNSVALSTSDLNLSTQPKKSSLVELTGASTELRSITAGKVGELLMLVNKTNSALQVINEDATPTASTRIITGTSGPVSIPIDASILLSYMTDSDSNSRWRIVGGTGSGGAATEQVTQTGIGILADYPIGTPLYVDTTAWKKANAMAANTAEVAGLIGRRLNDNLAEVSLSGEISGVTANAFIEAVLPARGSVVFLSTTDGKLTVSDVTTIGYVSKPIGIVHNIGATSVDIMFYNQRGVVVGSVNARTQIALANNAITPIQNITAYEAGELAGWVYINATTDYKFYFQTQFAKNGLGTDYNIAVPQTVGDTPPAGFAMDVLVSGGIANVRVALPSLAGFIDAYINYAINAPAVGTSLPLSVDSENVFFSSIKAKDTSGISVKNAAGSTTNVFVSDAGNVGIGTASPGTTLHAKKDLVSGTTYAVYTDNGAGGAGTNVAGIGFANAGNLKSSITAAVYGNDYMTFNVGGSGTTERMRIDASGNLIVTGSTAVGKITMNGNSGEYISANINSATVSGTNKVGFQLAEQGTPVAEFSYARDGTGVTKLQTIASGQQLVFGIGTGSECARFNSNGYFGIGDYSSSTITNNFDIKGASRFLINTQNAGGSVLSSVNPTNSTYTSMTYDATSHLFTTNLGADLTINSSGFVLSGTTDSSETSGVGIKIKPFLSNAVVSVVNNQSLNWPIAFRLYNVNATYNGDRFYVKNDGGIGNYSANNVGLSDERVKTDINLAGNYLNKICAIPVKTFRYKDQGDDMDLNLGVIAQDVEKVAPELVNSTDGFGELSKDEEPLKTIYQTDLQYALMKCIQELKAELNDARAELRVLKTEIETLKEK